MRNNTDKKEAFGLKDLFLIGLGILALAEEEAKKGVDVLLKKGEEKSKRSKKYVNELKEKEKVKEWEKKIEDSMERVARMLNLPTKKDIASLEKKIQELTEKIKELKKES